MVPLNLKSSVVVKNRLTTASSPIHIAQSNAKVNIKTEVLENLFSPIGSLKRKMSRLKERRRLVIPILDAEKIRAIIMTIAPNPIRRVFPSREESR
jgi:hypothetical protein